MSRRIPPDTILAIRDEYRHGANQNALAARYGLAQSTISKAVNGIGNSHVPMLPILKYCQDCGAALIVAHMRCDDCRRKAYQSYFEQWRARKKQEARP